MVEVKNNEEQIKDEKYAITIPNYLYGVFNEKFRKGYTKEELNVDVEEVLKEFPNLISNSESAENAFNIDKVEVGYNITNEPMVISDYEKREARNGNMFLKVSLSNSECSTHGNIFDDNNGKLEQVIKIIENNNAVNVNGVVDDFPKGSGKMNINNLSITPNNEVNPITLLKRTKQNIDNLIIELFHFVNRIEEPFRSLTKQALKDNWEEFSTRSAARKHHHAYQGGLLKHTVGLLRVADFLLNKEDSPLKSVMYISNAFTVEYQRNLWATELSKMDKWTRFTLDGAVDHILNKMKEYKLILSQLPEGTNEQDVINPSIIYSSIIFHDIGKIQEYTNPGDDRFGKFKRLFPFADFNSFNATPGKGNDYDELGKKGGHMLFGILAIMRSAEQLEQKISIADLMEMIHIILSHHGKLEWGSNAVIETLNASVVHLCDYIDSRFESDDETEK